MKRILFAAGLVIACGANPEEVFDTLPHLKTVRGRMQLAATRDNGAAVLAAVHGIHAADDKATFW